MAAAERNAMMEQPLAEADHVQLERLVTEVAWRIDDGHAETVHELFVDNGTLDSMRISPRQFVRGGGAERARTVDLLGGIHINGAVVYRISARASSSV